MGDLELHYINGNKDCSPDRVTIVLYCKGRVETIARALAIRPAEVNRDKSSRGICKVRA
jgi:hypothetical protein